VDETDERVRATKTPLIMVTTNEERELPRAFVRRCVELRLTFPDAGRLLDIARAHFPDRNDNVHERVVQAFLRVREETKKRSEPAPGTAEFLDTLRACTILAPPDDKSLDTLLESLRAITLKSVAARPRS
jgi:MoxR-like ATPase